MLVTLTVEVVIIVGVLALTLVPRVLDALGVGDVVEHRRCATDASRSRSCVVYLLLTAAMRFGIRARRAVRLAEPGGRTGHLLIVAGHVGLGWYLSVSTTYSQIVAVLGGVIALEIWLYLIGLAIVGSAEIEGMRLGFRRRDLANTAPPGH